LQKPLLPAKILPVLSENSIRHWIRVVRQNHRIVADDDCDPAYAGNVGRWCVQVAYAAWNREPVSSSSTEYRVAAGAASSSAARQRQGTYGLAGSALAKPSWCGPGG